MKFTKMHGCGNDYVYINGFVEKIVQEQKPELVRFLSNRHFGVGSDGVIFINPCEEADFEMEMYNADGSRAEMCGNGIRCVGKYVYDYGLTDQTCVSVISGGQIKRLELTVEGGEDVPDSGFPEAGRKPGGKVCGVRVNMGSPELRPDLIPVRALGEQMVNRSVTVNGRDYGITCVSMGNPHAVVFQENVKELPLEQIGPYFENHEIFPNRTNTEFVEVLDRKHIFMRVWERGSGETLACGTGCCAAAVACILNGLTDESVTVKLLGGELSIEWDRKDNLIYMTGPAVTVYEGEI